ncbi:MAG: DUF456 domain-containing protein [Phycisphaerales bacterium]|nr:DUF456 domain-containing protein [Phycisphaerales bacterium]
MIWLVLSIVFVVVLVGMAMTAITLPGIWMMAACSTLLALWVPEYVGWWTVGALFAIAATSEFVDFIASALGVKRMGGSRSGAVGSVIGTLVGAIMGTFMIPIPIVGSIAGGVLGAGLGAFFAERSIAIRSIKDSVRSGSGAAAGRLVSMVIKIMLAGAASAVLVTMVIYNAF